LIFYFTDSIMIQPAKESDFLYNWKTIDLETKAFLTACFRASLIGVFLFNMAQALASRMICTVNLKGEKEC
jgi:hypothetical protein